MITSIKKGGWWKDEPRNMEEINMMPKLGTRSNYCLLHKMHLPFSKEMLSTKGADNDSDPSAVEETGVVDGDDISEDLLTGELRTC